MGVYRHIRPKGPLDNINEIEGAALETLFLQEIKAMNDYLGLAYEVFYWRTRSQLEVDFVLYGPQGLLAFEIKRKQKLNNQDFSGLRAFKEDYPIAKCMVLYGGMERYTDRDISVMPFEVAMTQLSSLLKS